MVIHKGFRYRIYPTAEQDDRLLRWEDALRFLWNLANDQRRRGIAHSKGYRRYFTAFDQINQLTELRAELPWLADVPRDVCAQLLVELDKAWQRCFKRLADEPQWKKKGRSSVPLCEPHTKKFAIDEQGIIFPKLGRVETVMHRPIQGKPKTCSIVRDGDQWFCCICCEIEIDDPLPSTKPAIGLDRGVVNLVADSDGRIVTSPRSFEKSRRKLTRAQRRVARRRKGSQNQKKARERVMKIHRKARRQREAVLHRESSIYAKSHGTIVVERLNIRGMTKSASGTVEEPGTNAAQKSGLNRAILDAGWGKFVYMLRYKVIPEGGRIEEVPAAFSSQTCAKCEHIAADNRRSQSQFECVKCGHKDHADVNAAKVILSRRTDGEAVCVGSAVGRPVAQKLRVARRGTRSVQGQVLQKAPAWAGVGLSSATPSSASSAPPARSTGAATPPKIG